LLLLVATAANVALEFPAAVPILATDELRVGGVGGGNGVSISVGMVGVMRALLEGAIGMAEGTTGAELSAAARDA
jgi:hypothetical protein